MAAVKVKIGNRYSLDTIKLRAMVYGVEYDSDSSDKMVLYGTDRKINQCLVSVNNIEVTGRFDALEFKE